MSLKLALLACLLAVAGAHPRPYLGIAMPLLDGRIVGGEEAQPGSFPYQVSLQWGFGSTSHFCGGSILNENWVITAGHCVDAVPPYGEFVVKGGKHSLRAKESTEQTVKVAQSYVHEQYKGGVAPYDIALLRLQKPLTLNKAVSAIALPNQGDIPSGDVVLSGWGSISKTNSPIMPDKLQTAKLPLVTLPVCKKSVEDLTGPSPLHDTNVCTGPLGGGYSACSGDSGGPLVTQGATKKLIGIVSWGVVPCGTPGAPSVYTRVSAFNDWINNTMQKNA